MTNRVVFSPVPTEGDLMPPCWHCGHPVSGPTTATYLFRQDSRVIFDEWRACSCGAYQNARRVREITVKAYP